MSSNTRTCPASCATRSLPVAPIATTEPSEFVETIPDKSPAFSPSISAPFCKKVRTELIEEGSEPYPSSKRSGHPSPSSSVSKAIPLLRQAGSQTPGAPSRSRSKSSPIDMDGYASNALAIPSASSSSVFSPIPSPSVSIVSVSSRGKASTTSSTWSLSSSRSKLFRAPSPS